MLGVEKELYEFCQLMYDVRQFGVKRELWSGSAVEVPGNSITVDTFAGDKTDADEMRYSKFKYVFGVADVVPSLCRAEVVRYVNDNRHPCYCHILHVNRSSFTYPLVNLAGEGGYSLHGPSLRQTHAEESQNTIPNAKEKDIVLALHSPYWTREATEWINRQRPNYSTSQYIIKRVMGYGCDFVNVSHKLNKYRDKYEEWRMSFSVAELMLIKNWSSQQRIVYRVVRVLYKISLDEGKRQSHLCTYYFKTLMLWAVDTLPRNFWNDIMSSTRYILLEMIRSIKNKHLPHYFIVSYNVLNHLNEATSTELTYDMKILFHICKVVTTRKDFHELFLWCLDEEMYSSTSKEIYIMPLELIFHSLQTVSICNHYDYKDSSSFILNQQSNNSCVLLNSLLELGQLHTAIVKTVKDINVVELLTSASKSAQKLSYCCTINRLKKKKERVFYTNRGQKDPSLLFQFFQLCAQYPDNTVFLSQLSSLAESSVRVNGMWKASRVDFAYRVYDRLIAETSRVTRSEFKDSKTHDISERFKSDFIKNRIGRNTSKEPNDQYNICISLFKPVPVEFSFPSPRANVFTSIPGFSPTVPISWFINKAYTANHYYTLLSDYKTAEKICDEIISERNKSSCGNFLFGEHYLYLFSTPWIKMYDREIQTLLGLAALCRFVTHESGDRSVHIPVSPVALARYLKIRCLLSTAGVYSVKLEKALDSWNAHYGKYLTFPCGTVLLNIAARIYYDLIRSRQVEMLDFCHQEIPDH